MNFDIVVIRELVDFNENIKRLQGRDMRLKTRLIVVKGYIFRNHLLFSLAIIMARVQTHIIIMPAITVPAVIWKNLLFISQILVSIN